MKRKIRLLRMPNDEELESINAISSVPLRAEDVYVFTVKLCDNEIDKDWERFGLEALDGLSKLYVGKSGICDNRKTCFTTIYQANVVYSSSFTLAGDAYCYLEGKAYVVKSEETKQLIYDIEDGIRKEISIGCSIGMARCSVCGGEYAIHDKCDHVKGKIYDGHRCYVELQEPIEAYEWAFVAGKKDSTVRQLHWGEGCKMKIDATDPRNHHKGSLSG